MNTNRANQADEDVCECAYCGAEGPMRDVPAVDDDSAWRRLAAEHKSTCEWIATRAHRLDPRYSER